MSDVLILEDTWCVVINLEDQYSIWPARKEIPYGWREEGKIGTKEDCLAHVKEVWVDTWSSSHLERTVDSSHY
ncbi:MAG: MbtH family protein [Alphaproteobacteria bacterium]|nr:MbtH family protein [Alphaproteobacteria bacterium]